MRHDVLQEMPFSDCVGAHDEIYFNLVYDYSIFLLKMYIFILLNDVYIHQIIIADRVFSHSYTIHKTYYAKDFLG